MTGGNNSAGAIGIGTAGYLAWTTLGSVVTGQGGHNQGAGLGRSKYPPGIEAARFSEMKSATDKSAAAMHKDPEAIRTPLEMGHWGQVNRQGA